MLLKVAADGDEAEIQRLLGLDTYVNYQKTGENYMVSNVAKDESP